MKVYIQSDLLIRVLLPALDLKSLLILVKTNWNCKVMKTWLIFQWLAETLNFSYWLLVIYIWIYWTYNEKTKFFTVFFGGNVVIWVNDVPNLYVQRSKRERLIENMSALVSDLKILKLIDHSSGQWEYKGSNYLNESICSIDWRYNFCQDFCLASFIVRCAEAFFFFEIYLIMSIWISFKMFQEFSYFLLFSDCSSAFFYPSLVWMRCGGGSHQFFNCTIFLWFPLSSCLYNWFEFLYFQFIKLTLVRYSLSRAKIISVYRFILRNYIFNIESMI